MITEPLTKVFQFIDSYRERMINDLREAIAIKSISGSYKYHGDMKKMLRWTEFWLNKLRPTAIERHDIGSYSIDEETIKLPTVLLVTFGKDPKKKTVCIYCHLDVKEADEKNWKTDPFTLVDRDGHLYGRGAFNGKMPLVSWLHCIEAFRGQCVDLPVNVKFIIEGMHEQSSFGLEDFLYTQRLSFLKNIDFVCVNKSEWLNKTIPCISCGTCGICEYEVACMASDGTKSKEVIEHIFKNLVDELGHILIPKLLDDVAQITPEGERAIDLIDCDLSLIKKNMPAYMHSWSKQKILLRLYRKPSLIVGDTSESECNCGGGDGPSSDTKAIKRRFVLKIVPVQTPERCNQFIMDHIKNMVQEKFKEYHVNTKTIMAGKKVRCDVKREKGDVATVSCTNISASRPWQEKATCTHYIAAQQAAKNVYKTNVNFIRESKDIPIVCILDKIVRKNIIIMPLSNNLMDENNANECVSVRNYFEGIKWLASYLFEMARIK